MIDTNCYDWQ